MIKFNDERDKFNMFQTYPFFSVGFFGVIVGIVFLLLGVSLISTIFFSLVPLAILAKLAFFLFCITEHPLTKFCIISLLGGLVIMMIGGTIVIPLTATVGAIIVSIGGGAFLIGILGFLIRIFIAIFIG